MNTTLLSVMFCLMISLGISTLTSHFPSMSVLSPVHAASDPQVVIPAMPRKNLDKFGIEMIYPTKKGGEQWYINMQNPTADGRFYPQDKITRNQDGSWKMKSDKVRMGV